MYAYQLYVTGGRDGLEGGKTRLHLREGQAVGDLSGQTVARRGDKVAEDGEHRNSAVLHLHVAQTLKALLVRVLQQSEWIPETKRRLGAYAEVRH